MVSPCFKKITFFPQGELQLSLIDKDKLLPRMLVLNHLMFLFGLNGNHERAEVLIFSPRSQRSVRIVLVLFTNPSCLFSSI